MDRQFQQGPERTLGEVRSRASALSVATDDQTVHSALFGRPPTFRGYGLRPGIVYLRALGRNRWTGSVAEPISGQNVQKRDLPESVLRRLTAGSYGRTGFHFCEPRERVSNRGQAALRRTKIRATVAPAPNGRFGEASCSVKYGSVP
jgi:hypothetical protein